MATQEIRIKPKELTDEIVLAVECRNGEEKWDSVGYIKPMIVSSGQNTLKLDIFTPKVRWKEIQKNGRNFILTGKDGIAKIKTGVYYHSHDIIRIETRVSFSKSVRLELAKDVLTLENFNVENYWLPHQTPLKEMVIGDLAFRAPAVIMQDERKTLAIIPNLKALKNNRKVPVALTFSEEEKQLSYGCIPYRLHKNTYFMHFDTDTTVPRSTITYSYYIYYKKECRRNEGYRNVARRLWQLNYPSHQYKDIFSQRNTFEKYADYAADFLVKNSKNTLPIHLELQAAFALALTAKRTGEKFPKKVDETINLALSSPQKNGLFKVIYNNGKWETGSAIENISEEFNNVCVRLADLSKVCYYLCKFYSEIRKEDRILKFVDGYAERLLSLQKDGGHIPGWIDFSNGRARSFANKSGEVSAHVIFLCELLKIKKEQKFISCARRAVNFIIREIFPSKNRENSDVLLNVNSMRKYSKKNFSAVSVKVINDAAKAMLALYKITSRARYLSYGEKFLDELSLYQQIWQPSFFNIPVFGGFAAMNTDIHWNHFVQSDVVDTYLSYYEQTGKSEYFLRGISALRAAFVLMNCDEHKTYLDEVENIEKGYIFPYCFPALHKQKIYLPEINDYARATSAALEAVEQTLKKYGDLYVDVKRRRAFGINGVVVNSVETDLAGITISGKDFISDRRSILVKTDTKETFTVRQKKNNEFEILV